MADVFAGMPDVFISAFGRSATLIPSSGGAVGLSVIFRDRPDTSLDVVQSGPVIHVPEADGLEVARGDRFDVDGTSYTVQTSEKDGFGMIIATLQRTA